jgi:Holliday junction resolvase RusA-like endonuclease
MYRVFIPGRLPGLNEYTAACRCNAFAGGKLKRKAEELCLPYLSALPRGKFTLVAVRFLWVEKNTRRDKDNIAFAKKFIFDALVRLRVIPDDGWGNIAWFRDDFAVDKDHPGINVFIEEVK